MNDPFGLVGTIVDKKYRVDEVVAEGGSAIVYRGRHLGIDAPIAVKVLRRREGVDTAQHEEAVARFLEEAKTLGKLTSPGTVTVYDAGTVEGLPWIVLEWIEGESLEAELARRRGQGGRSRAEALALLRPVMKSIADAHDLGIAHRDLKPSNVMLAKSPSGVVARVVDFGIAKMMEEEAVATSGRTATAAHSRAFSLRYAAPEQLAGARTGPWTDVHALGLLLTELLTDASPYGSDDADEVYRAALDEERTTPAKRGVDVGAWEAVIARALAVKPRERYASVRELLGELESKVDVGAGSGGGSGSGSGSGSVWLAALGVVVALSVFAFVVRSKRAPMPAPITPKCTSAVACTAANGGKASICRHDVGRCVELASVDCTVHAEPSAIAAEDTLWIGTMFPTGGAEPPEYGVINERAVELARRELEGARADGVKMQPLGLLACDDAVDAKRAAAHLVDEVGVPAIVGFRSGTEAIDLATSLLIPKNVLSICSTSANPLVTSVPQPAGTPRLVWRTTYSVEGAAAAISALVGDFFEPRLRVGQGGLGTSGTMRVALLRPSSASGAYLSKAALETLRFNGKSGLENGGAFHELTYPADADPSPSDLARLEHDLESFAPHVILYAGDKPLIDHVFRPLEASLTRDKPRPLYASGAHFTPDLLAFAGTSAELRHRVFGVTTLSLTKENSRFVARFNAAFPQRPVTDTENPNSAYDAMYLLAYAAHASGDRPSGGSLSRAFERLVPPGRLVDVGPASITDAVDMLDRGERVDVSGATGSLDFDLGTGEAPFDQVILCAGVDEKGRPTAGIESGLVVRSSTRRLEGQLRCP